LASLVGANALIVVPPGTDPIIAGSHVDAILVGPLETGDNETIFAPAAWPTVRR
jgi:hypothetical protein